jgi:phage repressor protein C with HTH and peptisase S24 domain
MDMTAILGRIDLMREALKISDRKLSMAAGLSSEGIRNWRRRLETGDETAGANMRSLERIAGALGVSTAWLIEGTEDLGVPSDHVVVRSLSPQVVGNLRRIHCYDIEAAAGAGAVVTVEQPMFDIGFSAEMLRQITRAANDELALIRVRGESMVPTLHDGDWMMVDTTKQNINYDGLFILRYDDVLRVKRVDVNPSTGRYLVKSDNPIYEAFEVEAADLHVIGRVVWIGRRI